MSHSTERGRLANWRLVRWPEGSGTGVARICAVLAALATLPYAAAPLAQEGQQTDKPVSTTFESLDKNADGNLSLDEASVNDKLFTVFQGLDKNKDGMLSKGEYAAYNPGAAAKS